MPLSGGTAGAHDDAMHQGSAKRDVVDGVAGLDSSGRLLALGSVLYLPRNVSEEMSVNDRTSFETAFLLRRIGAASWQNYIYEGGVLKRVQTASMKDIVNGIAELDAGGALLAPGSELKLTRDGSNNIELIERTSAEIVARWTRTGVNDYQAYIHCGGLVCQFQHSGMKDIAGGIAGLDANVQLDILQMRPCIEEYSNHLGAVDNFTETVTVGNGTVNSDAANHEMDLSSGTTIVGCAAFKTKDAFLVGSKPLIFNGKIQNIINGAVGTRYTKVGFADNWNTITAADEAIFQYISTTPEWVAISRGTGSGQTTSLSDIVDGDILTIVLTNSKVIFYVNGIVVATHTANIPVGSVNIGFGVFCAGGGVTTAISCSADLLGIRNYNV